MVRTSTSIRRLIAAVVSSALCVLPLYLLLSVVAGDLNNSLLAPVLMMTLVVALIGVLLIGLPVHFFLLWRRMSHPVHYAVPGFAVPALLAVLTHPFGEDGLLWVLWQAFLLGAMGAVIALVFRRIALGKASPSHPPDSGS